MHNIYKLAELNLLAEMANLAETVKLKKLRKPNEMVQVVKWSN